MKAYILFKVRVGEIPQVIRHLRRVKGIIEANMTFGPYDALAIVETSDVNSLGTILSQEIQPIPGVLETLTCLAVETE